MSLAALPSDIIFLILKLLASCPEHFSSIPPFVASCRAVYGVYEVKKGALLKHGLKVVTGTDNDGRQVALGYGRQQVLKQTSGTNVESSASDTETDSPTSHTSSSRRLTQNQKHTAYHFALRTYSSRKDLARFLSYLAALQTYHDAFQPIHGSYPTYFPLYPRSVWLSAVYHYSLHGLLEEAEAVDIATDENLSVSEDLVQDARRKADARLAAFLILRDVVQRPIWLKLLNQYQRIDDREARRKVKESYLALYKTFKEEMWKPESWKKVAEMLGVWDEHGEAKMWPDEDPWEGSDDGRLPEGMVMPVWSERWRLWGRYNARRGVERVEILKDWLWFGDAEEEEFDVDG